MSTTPPPGDDRSSPPPPPPASGWGDQAPQAPQPQWGEGAGQPQWQGGGGYPTSREHAPGAVAALVLGILGIVVLPLVFSIPAIILGNKSKRETAANPDRYTDSLGQAGRICGWIGTVIGVIAVVLIGLAIGFFVSSGEFSTVR